MDITRELGHFPLKNIPLWNLGMERYIPVVGPSHRAFGHCACTRDKRRAVLKTTISSNGKGHFGPTDQPKWPHRSNIPVGPYRNGQFHLISDQNFGILGSMESVSLVSKVSTPLAQQKDQKIGYMSALHNFDHQNLAGIPRYILTFCFRTFSSKERRSSLS